MMTTEELLAFIIANVPNFTNPEIVFNGTAFHYSTHADKISADGRFKGTPINKDIDHTQIDFTFPPATDDHGVVFAYENLSDSKEEGLVLSSIKPIKIYKLEYFSAIRANHQQEVDSTDAPPTIIILAHKITNHHIVFP